MSFNTIDSHLPYIPSPKRHSTLEHSLTKAGKVHSSARKSSSNRHSTNYLTENTERELLSDIRRLDSVLMQKMEQLGGYFFSTDTGLRLTQAIAEELRRHRGVLQAECFSDILQNPLEPPPNDHPHRHPVYRRIRHLGRQYEPQLLEGSTRTILLGSTPKPTNTFSEHDLHLFLGSQRYPVSVWAPPASYPRFVAYFSLGKVYVTSSKCRVLRLDRFYAPNYVAPGSLFVCLLEFARKWVDPAVTTLELTTTQAVYQRKFKKWGWEVKAIKDTSWKIWYAEDSPYAVR